MNKKIKTTRVKSTYDEYIEKMTPEEKEQFDKEFREFALSEMILAAMEQDEVSVRRLAKLAGVSPTIVQDMRSGKKDNFSMQSFMKVLRSLDCSLFIKRKGKLFPFMTPLGKPKSYEVVGDKKGSRVSKRR